MTTAPAARELPRHWKAIREGWPALTVYERFEAALAYLLTFVITVVILVAFGRLIVSVIDTLVLKSLNPLEHAVFQTVFGEIMTLLIAMEFNQTVRAGIQDERGATQARVVILIALLALSRKVIILEVDELTPTFLAALGILGLSLGVTYRLLRDAPLQPWRGRTEIT